MSLEFDMDSQSVKSGFSYKSRPSISSRFSPSQVMTPESDCHGLKFTMEKIQQLDIFIQCHNKLLHCKQNPTMKSHPA
ncbi:hypothetical protein TNCV_1861971 [Trichonephila clavipes]|nr:hypothetical protein TNCV_1861971 [Trichonephila clavipes]